MRYVKKKINDRKEWKNITDKLPTDFISNVWSDKILPSKDIKFLANLVKYDLENIEERYTKYLTLTPNESKSNTLDNFKLRYGDKVGEEKFLQKNIICATSLDNFIKKYGVFEGGEKFSNIQKRRKNPRKMMIDKYGEIEGEIRYKNFCERNKGNWSLERQIEIHGEEKGLERFNKIKNNVKHAHTLESYIKRHGEDKGSEIYFDKMSKLWKNNFKGYSGISQILFRDIKECMPNDVFMFTENGGEYNCGKYMLDFYNPMGKKCIEFYGDKFHANPSIYQSSDHPHPFDSTLESSHIWEYDKKRLDFINKKGIIVHIVWEKDYKENNEECLNKCVNFLRMK